jgi:hypothetical protein
MKASLKIRNLEVYYLPSFILLIEFLGLKFIGNPPITTPRRHRPPLFTIYTDAPESNTKAPESNTKAPESDTKPLELLLGTQDSLNKRRIQLRTPSCMHV